MKVNDHPHPASDGGFTVVEVIVAATLLIMGALATLALLDTSTRATTAGKQRDVANALAQEMIERAQGGRYSATVNDMTDVDPTSSTPGPADRMRAALDAEGDAASTAVAPATVTTGQVPNLTPQTWTLRRKNTVYTVSYRACTLSDAYQQVIIQGPFDCSRTATVPSGGNQTTTPGGCSVGVNSAAQASAGTPSALLLNLQVLNAVRLNLCVTSSLGTALCTLAGSSPDLLAVKTSLLGNGGLLTGLVGAVGLGASVDCSGRVEQGLIGPQGGIATSTRLSVTVAWTDERSRPHSLSQTAVVRRAL